MGKYQEITKARQVLELQEFATVVEIKNKYRTLLKEWHPDLCRENDSTASELSIAIFGLTFQS